MTGFDTPISSIKPDPDDHYTSQNMSGFSNGARQGFWQGPQSFDNYNSLSTSNNNILMRPTFGSQQNLSSSFHDDELAEFIDFGPGESQTQSQQPQTQYPTNTRPTYQSSQAFTSPRNMSAPQPHMALQDFTQSPVEAQRQNPFGHTFDPSTFRFGTGQQPMLTNHRQAMARLSNGSGSLGEHGRVGSTSMSPITPGNPNMAGLQLGTSDTSSTGMHPIPGRGHRTSSSTTGWEGGFSITGSPNNDTPLTSPMSGPTLPRQLSSINENGKSLPTRTKPQPGKAQSVPTTGMSKEEQKKAKRRFAHNVVEQKRRDKINERIQELSRLVPMHRLEDNKRSKQQLNSARSAGGNGMSPTNASVRRSTSVSNAMTMDERDKTKGNSLDSAVTWTRDLMWLLQNMMNQESLLTETIEAMGGQVPFEIREDESRMRSELMLALKQCDEQFEYSRTHGSKLYVPDFTDMGGNRLAGGDDDGGAGGAADFNLDYQSPSGREYNNNGENQMWEFGPQSGRNSLDYADGDDFNMELS